MTEVIEKGEIEKSMEKALSDFLLIRGDSYFAKGIFRREKQEYPFLAMLALNGENVQGVTFDAGGVSTFTGLMTENELYFVSNYACLDSSPVEHFYQRRNGFWRGEVKFGNSNGAGISILEMLVKKDDLSKEPIMLKGVEGVSEVMNGLMKHKTSTEAFLNYF
ncbi:MAG: hypothetical protein AABW51_03620 [Nanoarchaeota archaeon]